MTDHRDDRDGSAYQMADWPPALREEPDYGSAEATQLDLASDVFPTSYVASNSSQLK